jgi:hypothetical protein
LGGVMGNIFVRLHNTMKGAILTLHRVASSASI